MNTITRAKNITARDALVALHNIELFALPAGACCTGKTALTGYPAQLCRITDMQMPVRIGCALPAAGNDVEIELLAEQRFQSA